jgi:hypothetical protein
MFLTAQPSSVMVCKCLAVPCCIVRAVVLLATRAEYLRANAGYILTGLPLYPILQVGPIQTADRIFASFSFLEVAQCLFDEERVPPA